MPTPIPSQKDSSPADGGGEKKKSGFGLQDVGDLGVSPVGSKSGSGAVDSGLGENGNRAGGQQPGAGAGDARDKTSNKAIDSALDKSATGLSGGSNKAAQKGLDAASKQTDKIDGGKEVSATDKKVEQGSRLAAQAAVTAVGAPEAAGVADKVAKEATKNGRWKKVALIAMIPSIITLAIPIFLIFYIISNPWESISSVITDSKFREFGLQAASAFGRNILADQIRDVLPIVEVDYRGPNTAIAAEPTNIRPGSTLERMSKIDWKKAQYQTLDKQTCGYELKLKQVVNAQGVVRSVPEAVINTRTNQTVPLETLSTNTSIGYCIQSQYPILNLMVRQPVTREINDLSDVHLSYAAPKDSEELQGDNEEVDQYVFDKTLERITPAKDSTIDFSKEKANLDAVSNNYEQKVNAYNANPANTTKIPFDPAKKDIVAGIQKMYDDMAEGANPYDLQIEDYINVPIYDSATPNSGGVVNAGITYSMCPFVVGFLDIGTGQPNFTAAENARSAIESRANSTMRGATKILTMSDTRKADELSNIENNATITQQDNWASSTAYQLDVNNNLNGVEQNPEATSTTAYNASPRELTLALVQLKLACQFVGITSDNEAVQDILNDTGQQIAGNSYKLFKEIVVAQSPGVFSSTEDFGLKEIITAYFRTGSVTAVSGLEDGPENYNRQSAGMRQLMNNYFLRTGGRFLTEQEAKEVALQTEGMRRTEEKQRGIAYRLFNKDNIRSARSIIAQNTITPKTAMTATGGLYKQLLNPLRSLASIHSSALYIGLGEHNKAYAADVTTDEYLKINTAGVPAKDFEINMLENATFIENILDNGSESQKRTLSNYDACLKKGVLSQELLARSEFSTSNGNKIEYFVYYPELQRTLNASNVEINPNPNSEFNKLLDCVILFEIAQDINNPDHVLPIRYRMYTYYNSILDQMVSLSSEEKDDSIYANSGSGGGAVSGVPDATADTSSIPCPTEPGITDGPVEQTYGPNRVPQNKIHVCNVQGINVNVSIASNLNKLINDAKTAGINFSGGGFRTYDSQKELRIAHGCPSDAASSSSCSPPTAPPGRSMHEKGLAIDFSTGGGSLSSGSAGFNWLKSNASKYGLINLPSEAWHWSINGK